MSPDKTADGYQPYRYDDPSANLWSAYLSQSEKYDRTLAQNWKGDMDSILIFAGLFSASVTAFIIESYKTLNPDPNDITIELLAQISLQLSANTSNGTTVPLASPAANWQNHSPSVAAMVCNILWFLSLGFGLICALSATLVEQWTRHYLQASHSKPAPQERARLSAFLFQGIRRYKMSTIVEAIPMLLHIALFLFFGGLVAFLHEINSVIEYLILGMLVFCFILYFFATGLPIIHLASPYWTPLSTLIWLILRRFRLLHRRNADGNQEPITVPLQKAREVEAIDMTPARDQRDLKAMCWTLNALREDNEFEPFVEVIPSVVSGFDYSAKWLMDALMNHKDISIKLGYRIPRLLATCTTGVLEPAIAQKRAITCLKAIWSLTMLSLPKPNEQSIADREKLRFREDMFDLLFNVRRAVPTTEVEGYILSASTIIARSVMDMQIERAVNLEAELTAILDNDGPKSIIRQNSFVLNTLENGFQTPFSGKDDFFETLMLRTHQLEEELLVTCRWTTPLPHVVMETIAQHYSRMASLATNAELKVDEGLVEQTLKSLQNLQLVLNQASLNLSLEYITTMLESDSLPHEAANTLRRLFMRINFKKGTFTQESQDRLVACLEEATEPSTSGCLPLPPSMIAILLSLTRSLSNRNSILKAIAVIEAFVKAVPASENAGGALQYLRHALPRQADDILEHSPKLDLFTSHLFVDAKAVKNTKRSNTMPSLGFASRPYDSV